MLVGDTKGTPLRQLREELDADLTSLRYIVSGGAPMPAPIVESILERGVPYR